MSTQTYSQSYSYDLYGNRAQGANTTLGLQAVSSSEINASTNRFINSGGTPTTYDAAGNITRDTKFRYMDYTYDANGRMTTAERIDDTGGQTSVYDCAGQRVKTSANNVTRTMVYDIFGQLVADYLGSSGSTLQRENIYRGGQLLAVYETAGSCTKSISDFVDAFYSGVHYTPTSTERNNAIATLTQAQGQGQGQLIAAAQALGTNLFTSSNYTNTDPEQFVTDLYWGYLQRAPDTSGHNFWSDQITVYNSTWANVRQGFAVSTEFQELVASLCVSTSSTSANLKYVLTDVQGSTRAVMNNNGSSSAILTRHDYLPFGEELWAGIGLRTTTQTYGATDAIRQKYGLLERDDATGLDHTWWRKSESFSGRWTSPDPLRGSLGDPQSFNGYNYTQNDPVNFVDPTGLETCYTDIDGKRVCIPDITGTVTIYSGSSGGSSVTGILGGDTGIRIVEDTPGGGEQGGGGGPQNSFVSAQQKKEPCPPVPVHPADADVDENIMRARQHRPQGPFFAYDDAKWFRDMVKAKAPWDYKRIDMKYEDFGNFNYGATGTAIGFDLVTLWSEAGRVQAIPPGMKEKPKEWGYPAGRIWGKGQYPYGDEPKDAKQIAAGRNYYIRKFVLKDCQ